MMGSSHPSKLREKLALVSHLQRWALVVVFPALVMACGPPPGTVEVDFQGTLEDSDARVDDRPCDTYEIEAKAGQKIVIQMISQDVDSYLILRSPDGSSLKENDWHRQNLRHAKIITWAEQSGTHTIVATRGPAGGTGAYEVQVEVHPSR